MAANKPQTLIKEGSLGPLYEIRTSPGRGKGLFAVRDIKEGTRIIAEAPLMVVPYYHYMRGHVEESFNKLSPEDQAKYMSLASAHGQDPGLWPSRIHESVEPAERNRIQEQHNARIGPKKTILSIMMTNAMPWGARLEGSAVFETWNSNIGKETIHATKPIEAGTEITVAYCDPLYEDAQRSRELQHYGFKCDCKACLDHTSYYGGKIVRSDNFAKNSTSLKFRLREIYILLEQVTFIAGTWTPPDEMERIIQLMEANTLWKRLELITPKLGSCCMDLAEALKTKGDYRNALERAKEGYRIIVRCVGEDSPLARENRGILDDILDYQSSHHWNFMGDNSDGEPNFWEYINQNPSIRSQWNI